MDGRGDVLVMAAKPGPKWSTEGVRAWLDPNHDVGGAHPIQSDAPVNGDGYEKLVFDQGVGSDPDEAWARISPSDPNIVQIAFKRALINDDDSFTWGAWAMNASTLNPAWFDYNDHFTAAEAGSPLTELTAYYPIKAFAEVDNTCRWVVGFTPTGSEPGICPIPGTPTPSPTATSTPTSTRTPTPILPATITGLIWFDFNNDGVFNAPPDSGYPGVSVRVRSGNCGAPGGTVATVSTNPTGHYSVTVNAGTYCVDAPTMPISADHSSGPVTVTVNSGGTGNADVRFWLLITMR
ncbi:MAG TPA: SdrD B-like domain-containing protein [Anaerolineales bacterium]